MRNALVRYMGRRQRVSKGHEVEGNAVAKVPDALLVTGVGCWMVGENRKSIEDFLASPHALYLVKIPRVRQGALEQQDRSKSERHGSSQW